MTFKLPILDDAAFHEPVLTNTKFYSQWRPEGAKWTDGSRGNSWDAAETNEGRSSYSNSCSDGKVEERDVAENTSPTGDNTQSSSSGGRTCDDLYFGLGVPMNFQGNIAKGGPVMEGKVDEGNPDFFNQADEPSFMSRRDMFRSPILHGEGKEVFNNILSTVQPEDKPITSPFTEDIIDCRLIAYITSNYFSSTEETLTPFELSIFRTVYCERSENSSGQSCTNKSTSCWKFHQPHVGAVWVRRNPFMYDYQYLLCPRVERGRQRGDAKTRSVGPFSCSRGVNCHYAHSLLEQMYHPSVYKTRLCKNLPRCNRPFCPFLHPEEQYDDSIINAWNQQHMTKRMLQVSSSGWQNLLQHEQEESPKNNIKLTCNGPVSGLPLSGSGLLSDTSDMHIGIAGVNNIGGQSPGRMGGDMPTIPMSMQDTWQPYMMPKSPKLNTNRLPDLGSPSRANVFDGQVYNPILSGVVPRLNLMGANNYMKQSSVFNTPKGMQPMAADFMDKRLCMLPPDLQDMEFSTFKENGGTLNVQVSNNPQAGDIHFMNTESDNSPTYDGHLKNQVRLGSVTERAADGRAIHPFKATEHNTSLVIRPNGQSLSIDQLDFDDIEPNSYHTGMELNLKVSLCISRSLFTDYRKVLNVFELSLFRTTRCPLRTGCLSSKVPTKCWATHTGSDSVRWLRRNPFAYEYKHLLCPTVRLNKETPERKNSWLSCTGGLYCKFAHSIEEQMYHPVVYKTTMCMNENCDRPFCPFLHENDNIDKESGAAVAYATRWSGNKTQRVTLQRKK